jgi:hypothetical protein
VSVAVAMTFSLIHTTLEMEIPDMGDISLTRNQHNRHVATFFKSKVGEFEFFLHSVIECCDLSMHRFQNKQHSNEKTEKRIIYAFSAFTNTVQTLKDAGSTFLKPKITWSDISKLRHGKFIWLSRNAATHDGNPVISAWVDGRYYVPNDIYRLDFDGRLIKIPAPSEDVIQFCLEFAQDFSDFLAAHLSSSNTIEGTNLDIKEVQKFLHSSVVPDFVRHLFSEHIVEIENALDQVQMNPIADAVASLRAIVKYCEDRLDT